MIDQTFLRDQDGKDQRFDQAMVRQDMDQSAGQQTDGQKARGHQRAPEPQAMPPVPAPVGKGHKVPHQHGRMRQAVPEDPGLAKGGIKQKGNDQDHSPAIPPREVICKRRIAKPAAIFGHRQAETRCSTASCRGLWLSGHGPFTKWQYHCESLIFCRIVPQFDHGCAGW